jgi:Family of unknown function (DUF6812)
MDEVPGVAQGEAGAAKGGRRERAAFETDRQLVEGDLSLPRAGYQSRFSDVLNRDKSEFISLTDAKITSLESREVTVQPFLVLSKRQIRLAYPCGDA